VRKELDQFEQNELEVKNLATLNHLRHPNIARLLACYADKDTINLIFPLAERGTLRDLL